MSYFVWCVKSIVGINNIIIFVFILSKSIKFFYFFLQYYKKYASVFIQGRTYGFMNIHFSFCYIIDTTNRMKKERI